MGSLSKLEDEKIMRKMNMGHNYPEELCIREDSQNNVQSAVKID